MPRPSSIFLGFESWVANATDLEDDFETAIITIGSIHLASISQAREDTQEILKLPLGAGQYSQNARSTAAARTIQVQRASKIGRRKTFLVSIVYLALPIRYADVLRRET